MKDASCELPENTKKTASSTVQCVERTLGILEVLSRHVDRGMSLAKITEYCQLHKSTVHRLVNMLVNCGYVSQDTQTGFYHQTFKCYEIGSRIVNNLSLLPIARPYVDQLSQTYNEAAHLVVPDGASVIYVHKSDSSANTFRVKSQLGTRLPMHVTAVGKSILASMNPQEVERIWKLCDKSVCTENSIKTLDELNKQLDIVRQVGYATDQEENEKGVFCVAAAILDQQNKAIGAISISAPVMRMNETRSAEMARQIMAAAHSISVIFR